MEFPLEPGSILADRYRLDRVLGEGGMGVVWAATDTVTKRPAALKLIKRVDDASAQRARLLREARVAGAVQHPNVRQVRDVIQLDDGCPVLVMEYLEGESLARRLDREGKLGIADFAAIFVHVVSAVGAAHTLGIVHRDLKPENIFLAGEGPEAVKVLDFGIAKLTAPEGGLAATAPLTASDALIGTPFYMSPEQAFGEKDVDTRADVWALGLIAYRCLSGILPTDADNVGQVFKNIVARPLPPLEDAAPGLPADVTALVGRMLSRTREDRPADLHEVIEVFARHTDARAPEFGALGASRSAGMSPERAVGASNDLSGNVDPVPAPLLAAPAESIAAAPTEAPTPGGLTLAPRKRKPWRRAAILGALAIAALGALWIVGVRSGAPRASSVSSPDAAASLGAPPAAACAAAPSPAGSPPATSSSATPRAVSSAADTVSSAQPAAPARSVAPARAKAAPRAAATGTASAPPAVEARDGVVPVVKDWQ